VRAGPDIGGDLAVSSLDGLPSQRNVDASPRNPRLPGLEDAGFTTGFIGKNHCFVEPSELGFDEAAIIMNDDDQ
jgi:hypothetical protein